MQISFQDIALVDNHPDDKTQHECITDIVDKSPGDQSFDAADQTAECVVEGVSCYGHRITSRYGNDLYEHIAAHACNGKSDSRKGGKEWVHPSYEDDANDNQNPET